MWWASPDQPKAWGLMAEEEAGTHLQPQAPRISDSQPPQPREPLQMGLSLSEPGPKATSTAPAWSRWANGGRVHRTRVPSPSGHPRETQPQPAMGTGSQDSGPANKTPATPTPCPRPPRDTKRGKRVPLLHLRRFGKTGGLQARPPSPPPACKGSWQDADPAAPHVRWGAAARPRVPGGRGEGRGSGPSMSTRAGQAASGPAPRHASEQRLRAVTHLETWPRSRAPPQHGLHCPGRTG